MCLFHPSHPRGGHPPHSNLVRGKLTSPTPTLQETGPTVLRPIREDEGQLAPLKASYSHARAEALITRLVTRTLEGLKTQDTENRKYYSITKIKKTNKQKTTCTCRTNTFEKHPTIMISYINVQERLKEHLKSLVMTMVGLHKKKIRLKSLSSFIS